MKKMAAIFGALAFVAVLFAAFISTPAAAQCSSGTVTQCKATRFVVSGQSTPGSTETSVYLPADGGFVTVGKAGTVVLRVPPTCSCTQAIGAVDGGACADQQCACANFQPGDPVFGGYSTQPPADEQLTFFASDAGQVAIRACCGRHFGNTGLDCAAVGSQTFILRALPK